MPHRMLKRESCVVELEVAVPAEQVEARLQRQLTQLQSRAALPGFRQGRVPASLLRRKYEEDLTRDLAVDLVNEQFKAIVEAEKITVFSAPWIVSAELGLGKSNTIVIRFEEYPVVDISDRGYQGLAIEVADYPVVDKDVEEALNGLREQAADLIEIKDRAPKKGDLVDATIVITPDGQGGPSVAAETGGLSAAPAGQAAGPEQQYKLRLGEDTLAPGLDEHLAGRPVGTPFTFEHALPGETPGGAAGSYTVTLTAVREYRLPELDDAFAKTQEAATVAELRDRLKNELTQWVGRSREEEVRRKLKAALLARYPIPVPPSLAASFLKDMREELGESAAHPEFDEKKWAAAALPHAEASARTTLLLEAIARQEQLTVTDADLEAEAARLAGLMHTTPGDVLLRWREKDLRSQVMFSLRQRQVLNYLAAKADIKVTAHSPEAR